MSDMTMDLNKQLENLRAPDIETDRKPLKLRDLLTYGIPEPKTQAKKHEYRILRLEQYF